MFENFTNDELREELFRNRQEAIDHPERVEACLTRSKQIRADIDRRFAAYRERNQNV